MRNKSKINGISYYQYYGEVPYSEKEYLEQVISFTELLQEAGLTHLVNEIEPSFSLKETYRIYIYTTGGHFVKARETIKSLVEFAGGTMDGGHIKL